MIGRRLLHYRVVEPIGQGGMSVVYRGRDENLDRDVAIKVLHPFLAAKSECRARLAREARAVARLEHPNILKVFDFSGDPATLNDRYPPEDREDEFGHEGFLVCELVVGDTLKHFADRSSLWDVPEVGCMAVLRLARALQHAHENGVVHRDIKPENVMIRDDGVIKLMDFGIAQVADQKQLTVTGTLLGSPAHMSPESIEGYPADHRSDIFSLGTVLYWLVTGALPFEALTPHALLKKIVDARPPPPQQRSPRVSDDICKILDKAMARAPEERYATAGDFAEDLVVLLEAADLPTADFEIAEILEQPAEGLRKCSERVRVAFLARAERLLEDGLPARALGTLSRVLAEHPGDEGAAALLERAQEGALDEEDEAAASAVVPLATEETARRRSRLPIAGALLLIALAVVSAALVGVGDLVDDVTDKSRTIAAGDEGAEPAVDTPPSTPEGMSMIRADAIRKAARTADDARAAATKGPIRVAPRPVIARRPQPAGKPPSKAAAVDAATLRKLRVVAAPYAHIYVDDREVARNAVSRVLQLSPGAHTLRFEHEHAKTKIVEVDVPRSGKVPDVRVVLDGAKPALLRVESMPPEAEVVVEGILKGAARKSLRSPFVIPFRKMAATARLEVIVHSPGHKTSVTTPEFEAGQTLLLKVQLEPDPEAGAGRRRPIGAGED